MRTPTATALVIASCATALGGCGSSGNPSHGAAIAGPALQYVRCLRSHGVPTFPDPGPGGRLPSVPSNLNPQSPAFGSASRACAKFEPGGSGEGGSAQSREPELLALAKCMRTHGVPSFSDPTSSLPPPRSGNVLGGNGVYLALGTRQTQQSPAFKRAAAACAFPHP